MSGLACCLIVPRGVHLEPWTLVAAVVAAVALAALIILLTSRRKR